MTTKPKSVVAAAPGSRPSLVGDSKETWQPQLVARADGAPGYHIPFICPRCKQAAEIWFESFKGGGTYIKARHLGERRYSDGERVPAHRCYIPCRPLTSPAPNQRTAEPGAAGKGKGPMTALEYIAILFNDCGFDTAKQRTAFMEREFGQKYGTPIHYADELEPQDRSRLIDILKDIKAGQGEKARAVSDE